ncbi:MAG: translation elongation factor 4 [Thermodesulfovibrionia bacterium]|nr:translation elongation factor 4 [Thermodesulfovibrionia bacterium]
MSENNIRNFSIIAHIDHGKSTLADRILELTGALSSREMTEQVLDSMDLEKERGITIKAHAVRLIYKAIDGKDYILNLIDTPGHVDFSYEVSRSLASCEGALLVVDATQGVEAQTLTNAYLASEYNLEIIPVINKIDLPGADPERVKNQIEESIGIDSSDALLTSAKEGIGIREVLEAIVKKVPPPGGNEKNPLKALIFDSWFDNYQGVIVLVRLFDGKVKRGTKIMLVAAKKVFEVIEVGIFTPVKKPVDSLKAGEVGYIIAGIRDVTNTKIGDTITDAENPVSEPCAGYKDVKPMVFCGLYPTETNQYETLKNALEKLRLNDSSFNFEPETSVALGFGFRCGFLGLLHMEIVRERLEREFGLELINTAPTTVYRVTKPDGEILFIDNPSKLPLQYEKIEEPFVKVTIFLPQKYVGQIFELCQEKRGVQKEFNYLGKERVIVIYELPLNEILWDFYDKLKSFSSGYASMDYEFIGYRESKLARLDLLINGEIIDALSLIVHKDRAYDKGKQIAEKLRQVIPRQLFEIVIQAAIGNKIIAREAIKALRKNVLAKCYGGDITRKRKLLEKQKEGKKKMKQVGKVGIPQEAFLAVLKVK